MLDDNADIMELIEKYPSLFDITDPGFDYVNFYFPPGWRSIIFNLCNCIDTYNRLTYSVCQTTQQKKNPPRVVVQQVKEKFRGLRFYIDGGDDRVMGMIALAEELSTTTCEVTGNPGVLCRRGGWFKTLSEDVIKTDKLYSSYIPVEKNVKTK